MELLPLTVDSDPELATFLALPRNEQVVSMVADLWAEEGEHVEMPVRHSFAPGMYIREMFIPKGSVVVGKIHRADCVNICPMGDLDVLMGTDGEVVRVVAPFTGVSSAGSQKIVFAREDTVWVNVFRTDETDLDKLESQLVLTDAEAIALIDPAGKYFKAKETVCLGEW